MPLPRAFKTDESFLEKIAMGATGTRRAFEDMARQGHEPMELERGSMSFKIWKAIKIKRVRVPDLLCLRCARRVESRAKSKLEITMSHSESVQERGWDFGLDDDDHIAFVPCSRIGPGPLDWSADPLVQYIRVKPLRDAFRAKQVVTVRAKGAQEGFEVRVTWPAAVASADGTVDAVGPDAIRYRKTADGRAVSLRLERGRLHLAPVVKPGDAVKTHQILAAVVPVSSSHPCPDKVGVADYTALSRSTSLSDRYAAAKALGRLPGKEAIAALLSRMQDEKEHIYVRVDSAAGLLRRGRSEGLGFLKASLGGEYLENRLETVIVLGEVGGVEATRLLVETVTDPGQNPEIRAGAAWSLGEVGAKEALPALVGSFSALETVIKIEAARALAKVARAHLGEVVAAFPSSAAEQRPGIAWALGKAGGFKVEQLLPALVDDDSRHWVAYVIGAQSRDAVLGDIEALAKQDPEVYFAVTVLWKILASWVYGLEEY
jgi:hypothetical protein